MKLLLIHSGNAVGGDSNKYTFVKEQGEALVNQGCDVSYFAIVGKGVKGYLSNLSKLRNYIRSESPDIIHAHYGLCGIVALLASKQTPVVITFHNGETLNWKINLLCSLFVLRAKHVIYVAQHIYDKCFIKAKKYSIIPCGVTLSDLPITPYQEARDELGWADNKKYILFGGSISNLRKNYKLLNSAITKLKRDDLVVIEMKGFTRSECVLRMCASDCFCLPSLSEGSPQALKEAIACNCPSVATDIADVRTLFGEEPGYYVSSFDAHDMANRIELCLSYEGRTNGRERIISMGLSNEKVAEKLIGIYNRILSE